METGSELFLAPANFLSHLICQPPGIHTDSKRKVSTAVWSSVSSPPSLLGSWRPPSHSLSMASSNAVPSLEPSWNPLLEWGQVLSCSQVPVFPIPLRGTCKPPEDKGRPDGKPKPRRGSGANKVFESLQSEWTDDTQRSLTIGRTSS